MLNTGTGLPNVGIMRAYEAAYTVLIKSGTSFVTILNTGIGLPNLGIMRAYEAAYTVLPYHRLQTFDNT